MNQAVLQLVARALAGRPLGGLCVDARLVAALEAHRVGAWLNRHGYGAEARLAAALRRSAAQAAALRAADDQVRFTVLQAMTGAGLAPIPLKGSVLGALLYAAPYTRPAHDLDVLVAGAAERAAAARLLAQLGFTPVGRLAPASHETAFVRGDDLPVELHGHVTQAGRYATPLAELVERSVPWSWQGLALRRLADEDLLSHWVVHAAHHKFRMPLVQWLDVIYLLRRGVDVAQAQRRCAAWGAAGAWYTAGITLESWFGIADMAAAARPGPTPWRAAYLRRLPNAEANPHGPRPLAAWLLSERMTWRFAARYLAGSLVQRLRQLRSRSTWRSSRLGWAGVSSTSAGRSVSPHASQ